MSLHPQPWPEPSGEITRVVMAIYAGRRAPMPMAARDELGEVFARLVTHQLQTRVLDLLVARLVDKGLLKAGGGVAGPDRGGPSGRGRPARKRPDSVTGDKAYSSRANRAALRHRKIVAVTPQPADQIAHRVRRGSRGGRPPAFDPVRYRDRNQVERGLCRRKQWRGLATRYDKLGASYQATSGYRRNPRLAPRRPRPRYMIRESRPSRATIGDVRPGRQAPPGPGGCRRGPAAGRA